MDVFRLRGELLEEVPSEQFALERDIQHLVETNLETLFGLTFVVSEFAIGDFRIDTLAFDSETNAFVIIEYKKGHSYSVVDQGYSYLSTMLENKADFILEYNERIEKTLKRNDIDWSSSQVIFVSPSFNSYQKNSVNFRDVPFQLWEVRRYSDGILILDQHKSSSKESIEKLGGSNSAISSVSSEVKVFEEEDHYRNTSREVLNQWNKIKTYFEGLEESSLNVRKPYISVVKSSTSICFVRFQNSSLRIEVLRGGKRPNGELTKGFFSLDDPKKMAREHERDWKGGKRNSYYIQVKEKTDIEYVLYLLKQKYDTL
jgi:hypothetical protein